MALGNDWYYLTAKSHRFALLVFDPFWPLEVNRPAKFLWHPPKLMTWLPLEGTSQVFSLLWLLLYFRCEVAGPGFKTVTNLFKKSPRSPSNQCKLPPETQNQTHFWASVKILSTHLPDVSFISQSQFIGQNVKNPWVWDIHSYRSGCVPDSDSWSWVSPYPGLSFWQWFLGSWPLQDFQDKGQLESVSFASELCSLLFDSGVKWSLLPVSPWSSSHWDVWDRNLFLQLFPFTFVHCHWFQGKVLGLSLSDDPWHHETGTDMSCSTLLCSCMSVFNFFYGWCSCPSYGGCRHFY